MTKEFQQKIYTAYKANPEAITSHGKYEYAIAYNATCTIHTWIIRRVKGGIFHWYMPLDEEIR